MTFTLVAYDLLKSNIQESINTLIRDHDGAPHKLTESLKKLSDERRIQASFLLKTIHLLDTGTASILEKSRVLNAAAYYIRDQIGQSYKWVTPERSVFFNSLTTSLVLDNQNKPEKEDLVDMYGPLEQFIRSQVYKMADPRQGYLDIQPYFIPGFSVHNEIKSLNAKLYAWKNELYDAAEALYQKEVSEKKYTTPAKGSLGNLKTDFTSANNKTGYELIKNNVQASIRTLIRYHNGDPLKLEEALPKLPAHRRVQVSFLLKTICLLDASALKPAEKAMVMNAAAFYVYEEIAASYSCTSPKRSTFFKSLETVVFNSANKLKPEDALDRYDVLEAFISSHVYVNSDPRKGYLPVQPYAIRDYCAKDHIKILRSKVFVKKSELFDEAELHKKTVSSKPASSRPGLFSESARSGLAEGGIAVDQEVTWASLFDKHQFG